MVLTASTCPLAEVTFAEAFKESGYRTALFGKWHVGSHRNHGPMKQGFDEFFGIRNGFIDNYNHYFLHGKGYHDLYEGTTEVFKKGSYFPELITNRALSFIEKNRETPFLLYLGFNIPHYPEQALPEHTAIYQKLDMPRRSYAAMITTTDHYIGQVLEKLSELGLAENTIVIFQSDNGHSAEDGLKIRYDDHMLVAIPRDTTIWPMVAAATPEDGSAQKELSSRAASVFPPLSVGLPNCRKASFEIRSLRSWTGIQACWNGVELKSQMLS